MAKLRMPSKERCGPSRTIGAASERQKLAQTSARRVAETFSAEQDDPSFLLQILRKKGRQGDLWEAAAPKEVQIGICSWILMFGALRASTSSGLPLRVKHSSAAIERSASTAAKRPAVFSHHARFITRTGHESLPALHRRAIGARGPATWRTLCALLCGVPNGIRSKPAAKTRRAPRGAGYPI